MMRAIDRENRRIRRKRSVRPDERDERAKRAAVGNALACCVNRHAPCEGLIKHSKTATSAPALFFTVVGTR